MNRREIKIEGAAYDILLDSCMRPGFMPHKEDSALSKTESWWWAHQKINDDIVDAVAQHRFIKDKKLSQNGIKRSIIYHRLSFIGRYDELKKISEERQLPLNKSGWPTDLAAQMQHH